MFLLVQTTGSTKLHKQTNMQNEFSFWRSYCQYLRKTVPVYCK